jgi:hypothetical protein
LIKKIKILEKTYLGQYYNVNCHFFKIDAAAVGTEETIKYLLEKGADKTIKDKAGHKAIDIAKKKKQSFVNLL